MFRNFKVVLIVLVVIIIAGSAYAFAAANTIAVSGAGYKDSVVSGYAITNVVYDLVDTDPTKLAKIVFDIDPIAPNTAEAVTVKISTTSSQDFTTSTCVVSGSSPNVIATCTFGTPVNVTDVVQLDIIASSSANPADS